MKDGEIVFVDSFELDKPKTAVAKKVLSSVGKALGLAKLSEKRSNAALIALADPREAVIKSFRNLGNVECKAVRELNPVSVLKYSYLVIENPDAAVAILSHRVAGKPQKEETSKPKRTAKKKAAKKSE